MGNVDKTSVAVVAFALAQALCYAFTLAIIIGLEFYSLGFGLVLFLLTRELLVSVLWRMILNGRKRRDGLFGLPRLDQAHCRSYAP